MGLRQLTSAALERRAFSITSSKPPIPVLAAHRHGLSACSCSTTPPPHRLSTVPRRLPRPCLYTHNTVRWRNTGSCETTAVACFHGFSEIGMRTPWPLTRGQCAASSFQLHADRLHDRRCLDRSNIEGSILSQYLPRSLNVAFIYSGQTRDAMNCRSSR
jgi:hypothetical protein